MPAWSLTGPLLLALTAPAVGDRDGAVTNVRMPLRVTSIARPATYRLRAGGTALHVTEQFRATRDRRLDRALTETRAPIDDPGGDSVRTLLRDRLARRGGGLDGRVEWRLRRGDCDLGLVGGLGRVIDALTND